MELNVKIISCSVASQHKLQVEIFDWENLIFMRTLKEKKFTYFEIILHNTSKIYIPSGFEHTVK